MKVTTAFVLIGHLPTDKDVPPDVGGGQSELFEIEPTRSIESNCSKVKQVIREVERRWWERCSNRDNETDTVVLIRNG